MEECIVSGENGQPV